MRHKAKRDANEAPIVKYLRRLGMDVYHVSEKALPDLLIGANFFGYKQNLLFEIKSKSGKLTPSQKLFFLTWEGNAQIIRSISEVKDFLRMPVIRMYKCEEHGIIEVSQRIYEEPYTVCVNKKCDKPVVQVYHAIPIHFKGNGWGGKNDVQPKS